MFLGALLCLAVVGDPMATANNGIYVSMEGYEFTVVNPHTIWATLGRRYHSAFELTKVNDTSYQGKYDAGNSMRPGFDTDPQISAQYDLLNDLSSAFPTNIVQVPLTLPCVLAPAPTAKNDYGVVKVNVVPGKPALHFSWVYANGLNDYSGDATRVGGPEWIDTNGIYSDNVGTVTISEQGDGAAKVLVGSTVVGNKKYKLSGIRVWDRGTFQLTQEGSNTVAGTGWLEWTPSRAFAAQMLHGKPKPTDQIHVYFNTGVNPGTPAAIRLLNRIGG